MRRQGMVALSTIACCALLVFGCDDGDGLNLPQRPQIFPRINPVNICEVPVGQQAQVDLMLDNWGRERLNITGFEVHHDRRCAFSDVNGDVRLYDNDETDEFAATARSRESAFMRIEYAPPSNGEDEITITVHSNAENYPDLDIYVCGAGTQESPLSCLIRTDPACRESGESCDDDNPCALRCFATGEVCQTSDDCPPTDDPAVDNYCYSPHYCVLQDPEDPSSGQCICRPCAIPPNEDWADCAS